MSRAMTFAVFIPLLAGLGACFRSPGPMPLIVSPPFFFRDTAVTGATTTIWWDVDEGGQPGMASERIAYAATSAEVEPGSSSSTVVADNVGAEGVISEHEGQGNK